MPPFLQIIIFSFGAVIGSFLNVVIWRLRTKESFIVGRSHCPHCRHELAAIDLVPIVSWLVLGGKCRYCRKAIGTHYVAVELTVGLLFLLSAISLSNFGQLSTAAFGRLIVDWYLIAVLTVVFMMDLRYLIILPSVVLPAAGVAALANIGLGMDFWRPLLGAAVVSGFFGLQYYFSKGRWIGGGDLYFGVLMGAALGWPLGVVGLLLAYVSGAAVGVVLLVTKRKTMSSQLPFGTFLAAATVATLLYGQRLADWYLTLLT